MSRGDLAATALSPARCIMVIDRVRLLFCERLQLRVVLLLALRCNMKIAAVGCRERLRHRVYFALSLLSTDESPALCHLQVRLTPFLCSASIAVTIYLSFISR